MSEAEARQVIDGLLKEAGWIIQDVRKINLVLVGMGDIN